MRYLRKTIGLGFLIGFAVAFIDIGLGILSGDTLQLNNHFFIQIGYYLLYALALTFVNTSFFDYLNHA